MEGVLAQRGDGLSSGVGPIGDPPDGDADEDGQTDQRHRQTHRCELEETEGLAALLFEDARDHEVRRRADEGHGSAQDGGERQRHQEAGHRQPAAPGPGGHLGHEHRDQRGVVEHRGQPCGRDAQTGDRPLSPGAAEDPSRDAGQQTGAASAGGHDVEGGDGERRLVREPGEAGVDIDHVAEHERAETGQQHARRWEAVDGEQPEHDEQHRCGCDGITRHREDGTGACEVGTGSSPATGSTVGSLSHSGGTMDDELTPLPPDGNPAANVR